MSKLILSSKFILPLATLLRFSFVTFAQDRYCSVSQNHTMCLYPGPSASCNCLKRGVNFTQIAQIIYLHNSCRSRVAAGFESRGRDEIPQPPASNMNALQWDPELARIAQRWADQCTLRSDRVRDIPEAYGYVGQNMYAFVQSRDKLPAESSQPEERYWQTAIQSWYNEVDTFDPSTVDSYQYNQSNGKYTQLVWGNATNVGCGFCLFPTSDNGVIQLNVCNYGAGGNRRGLPIYRRADSSQVCTQCGNRRCEGYLCVPSQQSTEQTMPLS